MLIKPLCFIGALSVLIGPGIAYSADFEVDGFEDTVGARVRGRVVKIVCSYSPAGYLECRSRPLQAKVDVVLMKVDGSSSKRTVFTNRAGRFSLRVAPNNYYVFAPLPPERGMRTQPLEITIPPEGAAITLRVEDVR